MPRILRPLSVVLAAAAFSACAVKPVPDPRSPGPVRDTPVTLSVCFIEDGGAHVAVGDRMEFSNSRLGRLRIRHIPGPQNPGRPWNDGEDVRVRSTILVEEIDPNDNKRETRRFVPVGRFKVEVEGQPGHLRFDFLASKATTELEGHDDPRCNVSLGDDEVLIRGVPDGAARHGGLIHLR